MDRTPAERNQAARWSAERRTVVLILAVLALRLIFAAATGLGIDESYTVATSRVLTLSTFDHPPLAWWIVHFAGKFFGESPLALRASAACNSSRSVAPRRSRSAPITPSRLWPANSRAISRPVSLRTSVSGEIAP